MKKPAALVTGAGCTTSPTRRTKVDAAVDAGMYRHSFEFDLSGRKLRLEMKQNAAIWPADRVERRPISGLIPSPQSAAAFGRAGSAN